MSGAPDFVDTIVDSPNPAAAAPLETPAAPPAVDEAPPQDTPAVQPSIREQIAARFKEQRQAEQEALLAPQAEDEPVAEAEAAPAAPPPADPGVHTIEPQRFKVKVRGNEFEMSREDVLKTAGLSEEEAEGIPMPALLRAAQINAAAQDYLTEAKTALKGSRTAPEPATATPAVDDADAEPELEPGKRGAPDPALADVVQKIQFGDPEEAAAALAEAVEKLVERRDTVRTERQHRDATQAAVLEFMEANPDIKGDPEKADLLYVSAMHAIREDLLKLGASPEDVEQAVANPAQAVEAHALARMRGLNVRAPDAILQAAADRVRRVFPAGSSTSTPAPSVTPSRTDVKRTLTPQPRQATVPAAAAAPPPQQKSGSSIVMGMRKARGQAV